MNITFEPLKSSNETDQEYLTRLETEAMDVLATALGSPDEKIRLAAVAALLRERTERIKNSGGVTVILKLDLPLEGLMRLAGYEGIKGASSQ